MSFANEIHRTNIQTYMYLKIPQLRITFFDQTHYIYLVWQVQQVQQYVQQCTYAYVY
jgi:hypothetical protein